MGPRKEQVVLLGAVALVGWLVARRLGESAPRVSSSGGEALELEPVVVPDPALALRDAERTGALPRELFVAPRDTAPLPRLTLVPPPLEPLEGLAPPAARGPSARAMGALLRGGPKPRAVPGLFGEDGAEDLDEGPSDFELAVEEADLSPEERAERSAGYRRLYDWIRIGSTRYGRIRNADRYALESRPEEPVLFVEVDPVTGAERFPGQQPIAYERERVLDFGFADTTANRLELLRRELGDELRPSQLDEALVLGAECIAARLEAPRALEIAEEVFRLADGVADGDPRPKLGLARCLEAGFRFEDAFRLYRDLLETGHAHDAKVHARLGDLLARFRLFEEAEREYADALRWGRTDWLANWSYGRYLLEQGRPQDALEPLRQANRSEPKEPEAKALRAGIRSDLGWALLGVGDATGSHEMFARALAADPESQQALAGRISAGLFVAGGDTNGTDHGAVRENTDPSFDLLLALGLRDLYSGDAGQARARLERAAEVDPFRAYQAWRALSWLAEATEHPEEALDYAERAHANAPDDPYTLYQRGRLLAAIDDVDGARASFRAALDEELDFPDALVGMAAVAAREGEAEAAERYFERALSIEPDRPRVHARRGFAQLELGDMQAAEHSFQEALRRDRDLASARAGLAWCAYLGGDTGEALTLFADLVEARRNAPEGDPYVVYAESQIARITDHEGKELWSDRFERRSGDRIGNGWQRDEDEGLTITLSEGAVHFDGQLRDSGRTRLFSELAAGRFVAFEVRVTVEAGTRARVGVFVARELRRRGEWQVQSEVGVSRSKEGVVQWRALRPGETEPESVDLAGVDWTLGEPMLVRIERVGDADEEPSITIFVGGIPVVERVSIDVLGRSSSALRFGVFVEGETGRSASVVMDDVEVVRRTQ